VPGLYIPAHSGGNGLKVQGRGVFLQFFNGAPGKEGRVHVHVKNASLHETILPLRRRKIFLVRNSARW
jgi:hypothetical protein